MRWLMKQTAHRCPPIRKKNETTYYGLSETDYASQREGVLNAIASPNNSPPSKNNPCSGSNQDYVSAIATCTNGYTGYLDPSAVINPPQNQGGIAVTPTLINSTPPFALGTYTVNCRNEPLPLRVTDSPDPKRTGTQASGLSGNLALAYRSIRRATPNFNKLVPDGIDKQAPLTAGVYPYAPYTPLLRAYQGDNVKIQALVGAHVNMHNFSLQGIRWVFEPANSSSGYRSNQPMGISEHFEKLFRIPPSTLNTVTADMGGGKATNRCGAPLTGTEIFADYFYNPSSSQNGLANANWGLIRTYEPNQSDLCLATLEGRAPAAAVSKGNRALAADSGVVCPQGAPKRVYNVTALSTDSLSYCSDGSIPDHGMCSNMTTAKKRFGV